MPGCAGWLTVCVLVDTSARVLPSRRRYLYRGRAINKPGVVASGMRSIVRSSHSRSLGALSLAILSLLAVSSSASAAPAPCRASCADLSVSVSDVVSSIVPGRAVAYVVTVRSGKLLSVRSYEDPPTLASE